MPAFRLIAGLLIVSLNTSINASQVASTVPQQPGVSASMATLISVPAGTAVPLTLVSQIKNKSTRPGDIVRAEVAFPVTIGAQLAIPAGTYVEGEVKSLTARDKHTHQPDVQIHFTRLLFANGYTLLLDAASAQAWLQQDVVNSPEAVEAMMQPDAFPALNANLKFRQSTQPTLPPLPSAGPSKGPIIGAAIGGTALIVILGIIFSHHGAGGDYVLRDAGWQFQMTLQNPIEVPAFQAEAAARIAH